MSINCPGFQRGSHAMRKCFAFLKNHISWLIKNKAIRDALWTSFLKKIVFTSINANDHKSIIRHFSKHIIQY